VKCSFSIFPPPPPNARSLTEKATFFFFLPSPFLYDSHSVFSPPFFSPQEYEKVRSPFSPFYSMVVVDIIRGGNVFPFLPFFPECIVAFFMLRVWGIKPAFCFVFPVLPLPGFEIIWIPFLLASTLKAIFFFRLWIGGPFFFCPSHETYLVPCVNIQFSEIPLPSSAHQRYSVNLPPPSPSKTTNLLQGTFVNPSPCQNSTPPKELHFLLFFPSPRHRCSPSFSGTRSTVTSLCPQKWLMLWFLLLTSFFDWGFFFLPCTTEFACPSSFPVRASVFYFFSLPLSLVPFSLAD